MKNLLLTFSCVSVLTASSGINAFLSNNSNANLTHSNLCETGQSLFANSYGALGNTTTIITNQSTSDQHYYSYDLSYLPNTLSDGSNPKNLFTVDNQGKLQYKSGAEAQIPAQDKSMVDNVKAEIEQNKKVTTIKNSDNPISSSTYDTDYFTGDNSNWKYLQFGGVEKHIDISHEPDVADNIVNSSHLSETLGLYYIAKAVITQKIDQEVAIKLAQTFVNKSSLASSLGTNSDLIIKIMQLLDYNNDVYNFILNAPFWNDDKNYSLNFIFDSENNLIELYYNKFNNASLSNNLNISSSQSFNGTGSEYHSVSDIKTLIKWNTYASTWSDFTKNWNKISLNNGFITTSNPNGVHSNYNLTNWDTNKINQTVPRYHLYFGDGGYDKLVISDTFHEAVGDGYNEFFSCNDIWLAITLWHDDSCIYLQWAVKEFSDSCATGSYYDIEIPSFTITSIMQ